MQCLKCGKEIKERQVFCPHCLEVMDTYPVKPEIHIQLPTRPAAQTQKKQNRKRRPLNADEQVVVLRKKLRQQLAVIIILILTLLLAGGYVFYKETAPTDPDIGKNYTYVDPTS